MLSSSVVTNPRVPRLVRHSLNLESGLNDGLALPAVLAFAAALGGDERLRVVGVRAPGRDARLRVRIALGWLASSAAAGRELADAIPAARRSTRSASPSRPTASRSACRRRATASSPCSSCAITLGIRRPDLRASFEDRADDIVEIVKLGIFVVFGSLLTLDGLFADGWAAVGVVAFTLLVARTVAIWIALAGTRVAPPTKAFMAWFGPKGVATMTFSLLVLGEGIPGGERIFNIAALVRVRLHARHGLTDTPGLASGSIRREARPAPGRPGTPTPPAGDAPA